MVEFILVNVGLNQVVAEVDIYHFIKKYIYINCLLLIKTVAILKWYVSIWVVITEIALYIFGKHGKFNFWDLYSM